MRLLTYTLILAVAAGVVFGTTAARGRASQPLDTRVVVVGPGTSIEVRGIDLTCHVFRRDPRRHEVGPLLYCNRTSAPLSSRGIGASMWHYFYGDAKDKNRMFLVARSP